MSELLSDAMEGAGSAVQDAADAVEGEVDAATAGQAGETGGLIPLAVVVLLGFAISMVSSGAWNHYSGGADNLFFSGPASAWVLAGSCGGLGYLFFNSVYSQCSSVSEACSVIMRLPPVVFGMMFLAALIPGVEIYLHPQLNT